MALWKVTVLTKECEPFDATDFARSVQAEVDDDDKVGNYVAMLFALFNAIKQADFHAALTQLAVQCKEAHAFKYRGHGERLWELKSSKKDRIYFYTLGKPKIIVLLEAHHKKDQTTPKAVKNRAETAIKKIVDDSDSIEFCKGSKP
ncbi:type II toxin-antitoxin system RelE/ParE family toxin [Cupriavidus sp. SIMBA_020]|uniref:type II toxin-antitoxin system RelE/ParE family toxin n=1 Tax=Cupriavidus sp. SIMBA_020 TaxID=3085766 RepID=UPI003979B881